MKDSVDVAVIGAGHAGLNAVKEIRKVTDNWMLLNGGPLGTTCARIGCMPSKIAIHLADTFKMRDRFDRYGVAGGDQLQLDQTTALEHVRDLRDTFVDLVLANTTDEMDAAHLVDGYAEIVDAHTIHVGDREIKTDNMIVATGARSIIPPHWADKFGNGILTVDNLFDLDELPESVAVIGLGPIGLEIGRLLGASMVGPQCEHLAHLICWAIESGMTVQRALEMPFYHPVIEEAFQDALLDLRNELAQSTTKRRYIFFEPRVAPCTGA